MLHAPAHQSERERLGVETCQHVDPGGLGPHRGQLGDHVARGHVEAGGVGVVGLDHPHPVVIVDDTAVGPDLLHGHACLRIDEVQDHVVVHRRIDLAVGVGDRPAGQLYLGAVAGRDPREHLPLAHQVVLERPAPRACSCCRPPGMRLSMMWGTSARSSSRRGAMT